MKMTSHELAQVLLDAPDLPIATHTDNHTWISKAHSGGEVRVAILESYAGQHIIIGNMSTKNLNPPNWVISKILVGEPLEFGDGLITGNQSPAQ